MSESTEEISVRLGSAFAAISNRFLPAVTEGLSRSTKKITFGASVEAQMVDGVVALRLVPHAPKIPTEEMDTFHFVLKRDASGQLSFLFDGTIKELRTAAEKMEKPETGGPGDDYKPGDNTRKP